jgi:hypothetical protein
VRARMDRNLQGARHEAQKSSKLRGFLKYFWRIAVLQAQQHLERQASVGMDGSNSAVQWSWICQARAKRAIFTIYLQIRFGPDIWWIVAGSASAIRSCWMCKW